MSSSLRDKIKDIPKSPGIYFWLDKRGTVLYVGRATSLRHRLSQYFLKRVDRRIGEMVAQAADIQYIATSSVLEAIILEAANIKKHWPKYNVMDRDDRSFVYVVIPKTVFPKLIIVRGKDLIRFPANKAAVFGPYQSYYLLRTALKLIRRVFPYGTCQPGSGRACFDYQIGLCPGACLGVIGPTDYQRNIDNIILLLSGEKKRLTKKLLQDNPDQLKAFQQIQDVALLSQEKNLGETTISRLEGYDISHHAGKESYGAMVVFENGEAAPGEYRLFKINEAPPGDDERALAEVLLRRFKHNEWRRPNLIMIDGGSPQISFLSRTLAQHNISVPLVGISKFGSDKLVFAAGSSRSIRDLAANIKPTLLKLREEAHRFANRGRKRGKREAGQVPRRQIKRLP